MFIFKKIRRHVFALCLLGLGTLVFNAQASGTHEAPAVGSEGGAMPRFTAVSENFELVGVLNGAQLSLYLDYTADNSPVPEAELELALNGEKIALQSHALGEFEATLAQPLAAGEYSVSATVLAGQKREVLTGDLDIHDNLEAPEINSSAIFSRSGLVVLLALLVAGGGLLTYKCRRSPSI